jgi:hypothetical protein
MWYLSKLATSLYEVFSKAYLERLDVDWSLYTISRVFASESVGNLLIHSALAGFFPSLN